MAAEAIFLVLEVEIIASGDLLRQGTIAFNVEFVSIIILIVTI